MAPNDALPTGGSSRQATALQRVRSFDLLNSVPKTGSSAGGKTFRWVDGSMGRWVDGSMGRSSVCENSCAASLVALLREDIFSGTRGREDVEKEEC